MNTAGIKGYICPNCKKPFTRLERGATRESKVIGMFLIFLSLPGILFALSILLSADNPIGDRIFGGGFFFLVPAFFTWLGLRLIRPKRSFCPNCGIVLRKRGSIYIAPGGIKGMRSPSLVKQRLDMFEKMGGPMGKIAKVEKKFLTSEAERQPIKPPKTRTDAGEYICPACSVPFMKTIQIRRIGDIILGSLFLAPGLFLIGFLLINLITGGLSEDLRRGGGWILMLITGIIFTLYGAYVINAKTEVCPNCKTELRKVGDKYQIPVHDVYERGRWIGD